MIKLLDDSAFIDKVEKSIKNILDYILNIYY